MLWKWVAISSVAAGLLAGCADTRQATHEIDCGKAGFALDGDRDFTQCYQMATRAPASDGGPDDMVTVSAGDGLDAVAPALFRILRVDPAPNAIVPEVDLRGFLELYVVRRNIELTPAESLGDVEVGILKAALFEATDPLHCYGFLKPEHQLGGLLCAASDPPSRQALMEFLLALHD